MTSINPEQSSGTMVEHVVVVRRAIADGEITTREAVDGLTARWSLTRVGALDLVRRGEAAFR